MKDKKTHLGVGQEDFLEDCLFFSLSIRSSSSSCSTSGIADDIGERIIAAQTTPPHLLLFGSLGFSFLLCCFFFARGGRIRLLSRLLSLDGSPYHVFSQDVLFVDALSLELLSRIRTNKSALFGTHEQERKQSSPEPSRWFPANYHRFR
jgi:hypothetical protein